MTYSKAELVSIRTLTNEISEGDTVKRYSPVTRKATEWELDKTVKVFLSSDGTNRFAYLNEDNEERILTCIIGNDNCGFEDGNCDFYQVVD